MSVAGLGIVMTAGAIAGFLAEHQTNGGSALSVTAISALTTFAAIIICLAYAIWRNARMLKLSGELMTRRDKLYNRILAACAVSGGLIGLVLVISGDLSTQNPDMFSSDPISPAAAIGLAFLIGILLPLLSWYWHMRVIDEQEAQAYRSGALMAMYAFWFIAPIWWLLWRGGFVAEPNGIALYLMTTFIALIVWFREKYQ
jgi:Kef-type K+ transport system membrane component KefB